MNTKTTLPISQARAKIFDITKDVQKPGRHYTFTEKGRPRAVMMSAEEYESLLESLEVRKIFPNLDQDIKQARQDYKTGNYLTLDKYLLRLKNEHGLSGHLAKKSSKRFRKNR